MHDGGGWGYWGWGWWFWVFWAVIVFLIIWGIGWGGGWTGRRRRGGAPPHDEIIGEVPREEQILREHYARGEITREEFEQKLQDLRRAA
jgi:putative membrane protein